MRDKYNIRIMLALFISVLALLGGNSKQVTARGTLNEVSLHKTVVTDKYENVIKTTYSGFTTVECYGTKQPVEYDLVPIDKVSPNSYGGTTATYIIKYKCK